MKTMNNVIVGVILLLSITTVNFCSDKMILKEKLNNFCLTGKKFKKRLKTINNMSFVNKSTQQGNLKEIMTSWNSKDMIKGQREIVEKEFEEKLFSFKNKKKCVNICIFDNLLIVAIELQNRDSIGKGKVNLFAKRLVQSGSLVCFEYIKRQMCYFGSSSDEQLALKSGVIHSTRYELYNCFRNWYLNEWLCETNEPTIKEQLIKNKNFTDLIIYNKRN